MPQNERLSTKWRAMLGDDWREVQKTWLHRLGNLTLTGYNSSYSDHSFEDKKSTKGGFCDSSVRLNKFVREQNAWTRKEIETRTEALARRAVSAWPALSVSQSLIDAANQFEKRELAARRDVNKVEMSVEARALFDNLRVEILKLDSGLDSGIFEVAETKSVSYHGPDFFVEVLPPAI